MRLAACLFLAGCAAASSAADARPSGLAEAVRLGSTKQKLEPYAAPGLAVTYTTPFLRVARAANAAIREGRAFAAADVEAKSYVPELRVLVGVRPVTANERLLGMADPKSARLTLGPGEIKASRMEQGTAKQSVSVAGGAPRTVTGGLLKAVFAVPGPPPAYGELEIRYTWKRDGREEEIVERVPLDFRKTRW
jgi:hypothetical protein